MADTVLIVDNDPKLRKLLQEYIEAYGLQILTLADGIVGLEMGSDYG
jgi:DNA-binding response OmpR family regulator